jgi:hypothetical protein
MKAMRQDAGFSRKLTAVIKKIAFGRNSIYRFTDEQFCMKGLDFPAIFSPNRVFKERIE